jgi:hypothetical protein
MEAKRLLREKRQNQKESRDREDRQQYRTALVQFRDFLVNDGNIAPAAWPERDELLERMDSVLWPNSDAGVAYRQWKQTDTTEEAS